MSTKVSIRPEKHALRPSPTTPGSCQRPKPFGVDRATDRRPISAPKSPPECRITPTFELGREPCSFLFDVYYLRHCTHWRLSSTRYVDNCVRVTELIWDSFQVKALYDFNGEPGSVELSIKAGELLTLVRDVGSGWYEGENAKGQIGLFPENYVEVVKKIISSSTRLILAMSH